MSEIILGEKEFIKIMQNYHSWTTGLGKRNIQCLIFALSLLNYIIDTKSLVCSNMFNISHLNFVMLNIVFILYILD